MNGTRLGLYHLGEKKGWTRKKTGEVDALGAVCVASVSGALGGIISSPLFLVSTVVSN